MTSTARDSECDDRDTGIAIICLKRTYGSTDFRALEELEGQLAKAAASSPRRVLIELEETVCIGCGFLRVLLRCFGRATENNGRLALCTLNPLPASVLAITRLDTIWETFPTRGEAIEAMKSWPYHEQSRNGSRLRSIGSVLPPDDS